jgi:hypothetical protein
MNETAQELAQFVAELAGRSLAVTSPALGPPRPLRPENRRLTGPVDNVQWTMSVEA